MFRLRSPKTTKIIILLLILPTVYTGFLLLLTYFKGNTVFTPTALLGSRDPLLAQITIRDQCKPTRCPNVYLILPSAETTDIGLSYCHFTQFTDELQVVGKNGEPLPSLGSLSNCDTQSKAKLTCPVGATLTRYRFFALLPFPKQLSPDLYGCR